MIKMLRIMWTAEQFRGCSSFPTSLTRSELYNSFPGCISRVLFLQQSYKPSIISSCTLQSAWQSEGGQWFISDLKKKHTSTTAALFSYLFPLLSVHALALKNESYWELKHAAQQWFPSLLFFFFCSFFAIFPGAVTAFPFFFKMFSFLTD